jgi:tetratricopeptide (TPR) repeat protein
MRGVRALLVLACLLVPLAAGAQEQRLEKAKTLFSEGKLAYEQGNYEKAYASFKESYLLSHEPALLYNISSALQGLRRPHEAAEALRSFLRLRPDDPEKGAIEERIRTLEEEQKLLDQERGTPTVRPTTPPKPITTPPSMGNKIVVDEAGTVAARNQAAEERKKKKIWMGVGISLGILAVGGVALGLALGLSNHTEPYTPADFGPEPGTR